MLTTFRQASIAFLAAGFVSTPAVAQQPDRDRVAILMFDGVQIIDFAGPYEVFGQAGFDVYTVSADGEPVTTAMNLHVDVDHDFATAPPARVLLIPGGHIHDAMKDAATLEFVKRLSASADHVLSVCTGSFILAATGLLDGKTATTFHRSFDSMASEFPAVEIVRDVRWVDTGKLVTSAGLSSGIDSALHVVADARGVEAARTVALNLEYDWSPGERDGFIRGLMADQHMRFPSKMVFPEGTELHPVHAFGDERRWQMAFHVSSPLSPTEFLVRLREYASRDDSLQALPDNGDESVSWRYADDAGRWQFTFTAATASADNGFRLVGELVAID